MIFNCPVRIYVFGGQKTTSDGILRGHHLPCVETGSLMIARLDQQAPGILSPPPKVTRAACLAFTWVLGIRTQSDPDGAADVYNQVILPEVKTGNKGVCTV